MIIYNVVAVKMERRREKKTGRRGDEGGDGGSVERGRGEVVMACLRDNHSIKYSLA